MNATQPRVDEPIPEVEPLGPGPRLRRAREQANMTLEDISARLHLDASTIEALETNAYKLLPAPTFVRGYLRGYARLVGLPQEQVVDEFDSQGLAPPALVADISEGPQAHTSDLAVRLATWAILGALVLLVIMWWRSQNVVEPTPSPAPIGALELPEPGSGGDDASEESSSLSGSLAAPGESLGNPTAGSLPAPDGPALDEPPVMSARLVPDAAAAAGTLAAGGEAGGEELAAEPVEATETAEGALEPLPGDAPSAPEASDSTAAGASAEAAAPADPAGTMASLERSTPVTANIPAGQVNLIMRFGAESWVEVYDRDERRLYFNLIQAGRNVDVTGPPPLRVLLGRAEGVEVLRNGTTVDIAPFVARGIARFTVEAGRIVAAE